MAIHASERITNWKATVYTYLEGLTVSGAPPWVWGGMTQTEMTQAPLWTRAVLRALAPGEPMHDAAGNKVIRQSIILQLDVFAEDGSTQSVHDIYAVDRAADDLAHAVTLKSIKLSDYATDETGATEVAGSAIRFLTPQRERTNGDGYDRVRISAPGYIFTRHAL